MCYVDLFAGDLQGLKAKIPYFQELGLTYLHLMPLFKCPEGKSDGGYAVSSYCDVNPALGTIDDLRDVIATLHEAGISAVVDFIFNHTSNEHEWAKGCAAGDPLYETSTTSFLTAGCPTNTTAACVKSSPTNIRAASPNWKTAAGYGRHSIPSNGT